MKTIKTNAPIVSEPAGGNTEVPVSKTNSKRRVPAKDHDFGHLCKYVSDKWKEHPAFTLLYIDQIEFEDLAEKYNSTLGVKHKTASNRPTLTGDLATADKAINRGITQIKGYLLDKYEEKATEHYAAFGIEHKGKSYRFPDDRNKRLDALVLIVGAIETEGFQNKKYGKQFWTDMHSNYETLLTSTNQTDSTVSNKVGNKNLLKNQLTEVLNSLIHIIIGNYPKNYKTELRNWGFQKEKY